MKQFSYGDIIPGNKPLFQAEHEQHILALVADHAEPDHEASRIPAAIMDPMHALRVDAPATIT
jgi:hypothetical protein